jgi:hypothetical protein
MMAWDWQPIETAPARRLVLIAICKGSLQCPVRGDRYVAQAIKMPSGEWRLFGQGEIREDEVITHWIEPELPEGYPEDADHQQLADQMADRNFPPLEAGTVSGDSPPAVLDVPNTPSPPPPSDDEIAPPLVNQLEPPPPLVNELDQN